MAVGAMEKWRRGAWVHVALGSALVQEIWGLGRGGFDGGFFVCLFSPKKPVLCRLSLGRAGCFGGVRTWIKSHG